MNRGAAGEVAQFLSNVVNSMQLLYLESWIEIHESSIENIRFCQGHCIQCST